MHIISCLGWHGCFLVVVEMKTPARWLEFGVKSVIDFDSLGMRYRTVDSKNGRQRMGGLIRPVGGVPQHTSKGYFYVV